jgi:mycofactocin system transcriptional regulator
MRGGREGAMSDNSEGEPGPGRRRGRPPSTSRAQIERLAITMFLDRGFDETTVDEIALQAGIGRRTFFRYFSSKNEVPWGDFDANISRMRGLLRELPADRGVLDALREAVLDFNRVDAREAPWLRRRIRLILTVPALQAHSMLKYGQWRQAVAEFAAERLGTDPADLVPQAVGWAALGVSIAAYEQWLAHPETELADLLDHAYRQLAIGFDEGASVLAAG